MAEMTERFDSLSTRLSAGSPQIEDRETAEPISRSARRQRTVRRDRTESNISRDRISSSVGSNQSSSRHGGRYTCTMTGMNVSDAQVTTAVPISDRSWQHLMQLSMKAVYYVLLLTYLGWGIKVVLNTAGLSCGEDDHACKSSVNLHKFWFGAAICVVCMVGAAAFTTKITLPSGNVSIDASLSTRSDATQRTAIGRRQYSGALKLLNQWTSRTAGTYIGGDFGNKLLEEEWQKVYYEDGIRCGASLMIAILWGLIIYVTVRNGLAAPCVSKTYTNTSQGIFTLSMDNWGEKPPLPLVEGLEYLVIFGMLLISRRCRETPSSMQYWLVYGFLSVYIPGRNLDPVQWSCYNLLDENRTNPCHKSDPEDRYWYIEEAVRFKDCSLSGVTATLMIMTWIHIMPWLVPRLQSMHLMWFWLFGVYLAWTVMYEMVVLRPSMVDIRSQHDLDDSYRLFEPNDIVGRVFVLALCLYLSTMKKLYLEKGHRNKFLSHLQKLEASKNIFNVFEYMVPTHMVIPMLQNPGKAFAEPIEKVSIMFILIADFDTFALSYTPKELLEFLNDYFTQMDDICAESNVTKIETVGEEYVACVGVVPRDIEESNTHGHGRILGRLMKAGDAILGIQTPKVTFKIGVHTGPIVAGVVGKKLPRYRLFGDTINTAARMMQKGKVGFLQFGEETHREIPSFIKCKDRGEVEMKGKGMVKAYLLDTTPKNSSSVVNRSTNAPRASVTARLLDTRFSGFGGDGDIEDLMDNPSDNPSPELFESMLEEVGGGADGAGGGLLSWVGGVDDTWSRWYHEEVFMKKFAQRLTRACIILLALTVFDMSCLLFLNKTETDGYNLLEGGPKRFSVYFSCRILSLAIAFFWRFAYKKWTAWIHDSASEVQTWILASTCIILIFTFISYNSLTQFDSSDSSDSIPTTTTATTTQYSAPSDEVFLPTFALSYYYMSRQHPFRFLPSLIFVPLSVALMVLVTEPFDKKLDLGTLFFSISGKVLFVINSILTGRMARDEELVSRARFRARTAVDETQRRTQQILNTLMPPLVVQELRDAPGVLPSHHYKDATIAQSDLCGFTKLAATRTPSEVVTFISDLFGQFDELTDKYGIYKVETVGDAYIAGQAEAPLTETNNPVNVVLFGLDMVTAVQDWSKKLGGEPVNCRVGIHSGECIGGIVGTDMQRYHLFGGLMTVVEVLESTAREGLVQVSPACRDAVSKSLAQEGMPSLMFKFEKRNETDLRTSKGELHSYDEVGGVTSHVYLS